MGKWLPEEILSCGVKCGVIAYKQEKKMSRNCTPNRTWIHRIGRSRDYESGILFTWPLESCHFWSQALQNVSQKSNKLFQSTLLWILGSDTLTKSWGGWSESWLGVQWNWGPFVMLCIIYFQMACKPYSGCLWGSWSECLQCLEQLASHWSVTSHMTSTKIQSNSNKNTWKVLNQESFKPDSSTNQQCLYALIQFFINC